MALTLRAGKSELAKLALPVAGRPLLLSTFNDVPVEEFLDRHLAPDRAPSSKGVTTTRREVLSLYRDVWRATRAFTWSDEQGVPWKDMLRLSARRELEAARFETNPETIAKLVFVGQEAVSATLTKFEQKRQEMITDIAPEETRRP